MSVKTRPNRSKKERQRRKEARRRDEMFQRALEVIKEKDPEEYERILREPAWNQLLGYRDESERIVLRSNHLTRLAELKVASYSF